MKKRLIFVMMSAVFLCSCGMAKVDVDYMCSFVLENNTSVELKVKESEDSDLKTVKLNEEERLSVTNQTYGERQSAEILEQAFKGILDYELRYMKNKGVCIMYNDSKLSDKIFDSKYWELSYDEDLDFEYRLTLTDELVKEIGY